MDASWDGSVPRTILGHYDLDLVSRIIVFGAYLLYYLRYRESHICCFDASWDNGVLLTIFGHFDLEPVSRIVASGVYLLYYLR